jgi:hypothetical protein
MISPTLFQSSRSENFLSNIYSIAVLREPGYGGVVVSPVKQGLKLPDHLQVRAAKKHKA